MHALRNAPSGLHRFRGGRCGTGRLRPADMLPSTGFVAIAGGRILMSYGDIQTVSYLASVTRG